MGQLNFRKAIVKLKTSNTEASGDPAVSKSSYVSKINKCNVAMAINAGIAGYLIYQNIKPATNDSKISLNNENYVTKYFNYVEAINIGVTLHVFIKRIITGYDAMFEDAKPYLPLFNKGKDANGNHVVG